MIFVGIRSIRCHSVVLCKLSDTFSKSSMYRVVGSFTMCPSAHAVGVFSSSQRSRRARLLMSLSTLKSSGGVVRASSLVSFQSLDCSLYFCLLVCHTWFVVVSRLFRTSLKCLTHLLSCASRAESSRLFLSVIGLLLCRYAPDSFLVMVSPCSLLDCVESFWCYPLLVLLDPSP